jgi:hypothetical protein
VESYTNAPNAMARTSLSNSTKATKAIGGIREEEQKRQQMSQRSRSRVSLTKRKN